jgi:glutathione S-transferase
VPIKSVAVWDTVGSMGVPLYLSDKRYDVFQFTDTKLSDKVESGFHAMAVDELRLDFPVTQWEQRTRVEQVWFVGAHADVGGGYTESESRLSDVALQWMMQKVSAVGVRLATPLSRVPDCQCGVQKIHMPWENSPFSVLPKSQRNPTIEDTFHTSLVERWKNDTAYRPKALSFVTTQTVDRLRVIN